MQTAIPSPLHSFNVDVQLIARIQTHAGARCHEASNLLNCYTLWAELNHRAVRAYDARNEHVSREILEKTEVDLHNLKPTPDSDEDEGDRRRANEHVQ
jgi:hypothetical protein